MIPIPDPFLALFAERPEIYKCPKCNGSIADWVVTSKFECPDCNRKLASNKKSATKQSAIFAVVLYAVLLILINVFSFSENIKLILYIAAGILPLLAYYFGFRILFKLKVLKNH